MNSALEFPPFPGFRPAAFEFMRELGANNNREWFKPRKSVFDDEIWWPFQCLVADVSRRLAEERLPLTGDPARALFRIYRDVRFSKNKEPYKTNTGAVLSPDGSRDSLGAGYIHFEPGSCMLAAGFWMPPTELVRVWRARIVEEPDDFLELVNVLDARGLKIESDEYLKRLPQGYEAHADSPVAPWLKHKSYWVGRRFTDDAYYQPGFTEEVVRMMRDALPLLEYGWELAKSIPLPTRRRE